MEYAITNFTDALAALSKYYDSGRNKYAQPGEYTLDNMRAIMAHLGNPQDTLKVVHVAGTSGKTSTAYYVSALLTAAGYKTGLTVSPHVDLINERVQINMEPLPEKQFCEALNEFLSLMDKSPVQPSWFEAMVALAYWYFAKAKVDYAVIEVGLGGLQDGTNVITRRDKVCIITDIGYDHMAILGNTLAEIAWQKAGIIQPGNTAFTYQQSLEIMERLTTRATEQGAKLHTVKETILDLPVVQKLPQFQQHNLGIALASVQFALQQEVTPEQIEKAAQTIIPGRMEVVKNGGKTIILDGAHNAQKLGAFFDSVRTVYPGKRPLVLAAFMEGDSDRWHEAIDVLVQNDIKLVLTDFYSEKDYKKFSVNPDIVADFCAKHGLPAVVVNDPAKAYDYVISQDDELVIVTGSFYLLNHVRPLAMKARKT